MSPVVRKTFDLPQLSQLTFEIAVLIISSIAQHKNSKMTGLSIVTKVCLTRLGALTIVCFLELTLIVA